MQLPIAKPLWKTTTLGRRLESMCRKALFEFALLEGVDQVAVALSGGKDSLSLLYLLHAISGRGSAPFALHAIHVKGEFSCGASVHEGYLQSICRELGVPLIVAHSQQRAEHLECYRCSRERRKLIFEAAKERGIRTIAFGHHREDSIQTLLMNLLHKAEFAANLPKVPMHAYGVTIIRPLIYIPEADLRRFAEQHGFARIVCQCPVGQRALRKRTEALLCQIEALFPNARQNLSQASLQFGSKKALIP